MNNIIITKNFIVSHLKRVVYSFLFFNQIRTCFVVVVHHRHCHLYIVVYVTYGGVRMYGWMYLSLFVF